MLPTLGSKGQGWVALQVVVLVACGAAAILGPPWPAGFPSWLPFPGVILCLAGGAMAVTGMLGLGRDLTPMPRPGTDADVRTSGVYALVRHPIYGGLIEAAIGLSLLTSPAALATAVLLALLFEAKSRVEERWLVEHDPSYEEYRRQVSKRFIPGVW